MSTLRMSHSSICCRSFLYRSARRPSFGVLDFAACIAMIAGRFSPVVMKPLDLFVAAMVCLFWGVNAAAAKLGVTYVPPIFFTTLRFLILLLLLLPWLRTQPVKGQWGVLLPAVFFMGALHFALIFTGAKLSSASAMAIVNQLYVPIAAVLAWFWLGEPVPLRRAAGVAVAFAGVALFSLDPNMSGHGLGILLLVLDAVSMAIGTVLLRRLTGISPLVMQAWMAAVGLPLLALSSLLLESGQMAALHSAPPQAWAALAFTVVGGSLIGHSGYYYLLQRHDVSLVTSMLLVAPMIGVLSGVVLLGEPFTVRIALGAFLTIAGVGVVLMREEWAMRLRSPV
jgi:O-acetylserine/cysteine efflux transporter